jgi:excisionase family DNA binding protein
VTSKGSDPKSFSELPEAFSVIVAAKFLGVSPSTIYEQIRTHKLVAVKVGRRFLVTRHALQKYLGIEHEDVRLAAPIASADRSRIVACLDKIVGLLGEIRLELTERETSRFR